MLFMLCVSQKYLCVVCWCMEFLNRLFNLLKRFPIESKGRRKKLHEVCSLHFMNYLLKICSYIGTKYAKHCLKIGFRLDGWPEYVLHASWLDVLWWVIFFIFTFNNKKMLINKKMQKRNLLYWLVRKAKFFVTYVVDFIGAHLTWPRPRPWPCQIGEHCLFFVVLYHLCHLFWLDPNWWSWFMWDSPTSIT
jgi:Protein of unknown function (DUF1084)